MNQTLKFRRPTYDRLQHYARTCEDELLGLLVSPLGVDAVTGALMLPAQATTVHAKAEPADVHAALDYLADCGCVARGYVHTHPNMPTFHSSTDDALMRTQLLGLCRFDPSGDPPLPVVLNDHEAILENVNGRRLKFSLLGPQAGDVFEAVAWSRIVAEAEAQPKQAPPASFDGDRLVLAGASIRLELGIPRTATLIQTSEPQLPRTGKAFSVVLNGTDHFVEAMYLNQMTSGRELVEKVDCELDIIDDDDDAYRPVANRDFLFFNCGDSQAAPAQHKLRGSTVRIWRSLNGSR